MDNYAVKQAVEALKKDKNTDILESVNNAKKDWIEQRQQEILGETQMRLAEAYGLVIKRMPDGKIMFEKPSSGSIIQDGNSFYRGTVEEPYVDENGNLHLYGRKDPLYEKMGVNEKGVSVGVSMDEAVEYGYGQMESYKNDASESYDAEQLLEEIDNAGFYLIQIDKNSVSEAHLFRNGSEYKLIGDEIIIPKGKFKLEHIVHDESDVKSDLQISFLNYISDEKQGYYDYNSKSSAAHHVIAISLTNGDPSTFNHELAHHYVRMFWNSKLIQTSL
jgi:hypothetical protein